MIFYAVITKENSWYVATAVPSGVVSQGKTIEEAQENLKEALGLYYEHETLDEDNYLAPLIAPLEVEIKHG